MWPLNREIQWSRGAFAGVKRAKEADDKYFECKNASNKGQIYENGMAFLRKVQSQKWDPRISSKIKHTKFPEIGSLPKQFIFYTHNVCSLDELCVLSKIKTSENDINTPPRRANN